MDGAPRLDLVRLLRILATLAAVTVVATGCSSPDKGIALQKCVNGLADAGQLPRADDVKLDLQVDDEGSVFKVVGVAYVTTTAGAAESYQIACTVEPGGNLASAEADRLD